MKIVKEKLIQFPMLLFAMGLMYSAQPTSFAGENDDIVVESLLRLPTGKKLVTDNAKVKRSVDRYLIQHKGTWLALRAIDQLDLRDQADALNEFLTDKTDSSLRVKALRLLLRFGRRDSISTVLEKNDAAAVQIASGLGLIGTADSESILKNLLAGKNTKAIRIAATSALGRTTNGRRHLVELHQTGLLPNDCRYAAYEALSTSTDPEIQKIAGALKPAATKSGESLPPVSKLIRMRGDGKAGKRVFHGKGTCGKCHKVHGEGKEVGPDLSEIGSKLSREALYTAILNPSAGISHNFEQHMLLTEDGLVLNGLLHSQNDEQVTIKTAEGILRSIPRDEIDELTQSDVSLMPADLHQLLTVQELLDLIDYMVLLRDESQRGFHVLNDSTATNGIESASRELDDATKGLTVASGLKVSIFAGEPELRNPSNIDVDHLGRVWVCEVINYRHFRNPYNPVRSEGDRILVLEDTDGDHVADKTTVFYQGTDVNSAHGICVLGDRVIVSAGDSVFVLVDTNGDLKADDKQLMFTGIGGVEHDHGIHAFVPGPDGKLYFNFGNEGHQIKDAQGNPIIDSSGRVVSDKSDPYQQGMVLRCDIDGSNVETLAWNFRNNWEICVDSFGTMWQSDNDDDGNRATRINYVMPFGNYGYRSEIDGATWSTPRTGMHNEIPLRHWHLNDPGVVPNVVQTGAGSPTGITKYEGTLLPARFRDQLIHCDPGPNSVRAFELSDDGAGYKGKQIPLLTGTGDKWFRPVDACVAPDGSLIVADWYDPGVGGHRMGDTDRGRIFRVSAEKESKSHSDRTDEPIELLKSPNISARFLAAEQLRKQGAAAVPDMLSTVRESESATHRARALWVLADVDVHQAVELAMKDSDQRVRCVALRVANQHLSDAQVVRLAGRAKQDSSPQVRREAVLSLRGRKSMATTWAQLALLHDGNDRWYVEALGIAAENNWDACLEAWLELVGDDWDELAGRDIIWRSRANKTSQLLAEILTHNGSKKKTENHLRYMRAFDFQPETPGKRQALKRVAQAASGQPNN